AALSGRKLAGSRHLPLAEEKIGAIVLLARVGHGRLEDRYNCRLARAHGLTDRGSALHVSVAGRPLDDPARTQYRERHECANTHLPPRSLAHRPILRSRISRNARFKIHGTAESQQRCQLEVRPERSADGEEHSSSARDWNSLPWSGARRNRSVG